MNLACDNNENGAYIREHGGVEAIVAGMVAHRAVLEPQRQACGALMNLAFDDENQVYIREHGGVEAIVAGM
eukprot:531792-Hanusia_phi.AAC.1